MHRLATFGVWLVGAIIPSLGYWYVTVYVFDTFDRGYGRDTWFLLQLYVTALATVAGLVGFGATALIRSRPMALVAVLVAGAAFAVCYLLAVALLRGALPYQDPVPQQLVAALIIGALSTLAATG